MQEYIPTTAFGDIAVSVAILAGSLGSVYSVISAKRAKHAAVQAEAANKAVNGNPDGQPRAYDLLLANTGALEDLHGEILDVASEVQRVNGKLDEHLSWHHQETQVKPKCAGACKKVAAAPVKPVAKKAVAKKSAPRVAPSGRKRV